MSVCLLACNPFQFMDSVIRLYVVLPLITSGKRRCAKLDFKLQKTIFKFWILKFYFGPP